MTPNCPDCCAATQPWHRVGDRNRRVTTERFQYARCTRCRLVFLVDVPADLGRYYPTDYYSLPASRADLVAGSRPHDAYKVEIARRFVPRGRLVEIGPGIGGFSALAQDAGYDVSALEMDARASGFLRDVVGVDTTTTADIDQALADEGPYDLVAMWHVLEHLTEPRATLRAASRALNPGGVILLAAPNPDAFQLKVLGRRWTHIDAPRHLFLIPIASLELWARDLGLDVVLVTTTDPGTIGWNSFGWRETLAHSVRNVKGGHALRAVGNVMTAAAAPIERRGRRGSTYTVALRKPA